MQIKILRILTVVFAVVSIVACSSGIAGKWTVQKYETINIGEQGATLHNIGTIEFFKDGTGTKNLTFGFVGEELRDSTPLRWAKSGDKYITIESNSSELSKIWIIVKDKGNYQKWQSTDGINRVQTLELKR